MASSSSPVGSPAHVESSAGYTRTHRSTGSSSSTSSQDDSASTHSSSSASSASSLFPQQFNYALPRKPDGCPSPSQQTPPRRHHGLGLGSIDLNKQSVLRRASADANMPNGHSHVAQRAPAQYRDHSTPAFELPPTPPSDKTAHQEWYRASQVPQVPQVPAYMERSRATTPPLARFESPPSFVDIPSLGDLKVGTAYTPSVATIPIEPPVTRSRFLNAREIMALGELPYLAGIRAIASIGIQVYHIYGEDMRYFNFFISASLAAHFAQGGFLITSALLMLQSRIRNKGWWHMHDHVPTFFFARWARLYPALIVMLAINSYWWLNRYDMPMHLAKLVTRSMLKIQHTSILDVGNDPPNPFQHTWFLDVQEQFYLFWSLALPLILPLPVVGRYAVLGSLFTWSYRKRQIIDRENATLRINLYKMLAGCALVLVPIPRFMIHRHMRTLVLLSCICFVAYGFSPRLNDGHAPAVQRLYGDNAGVLIITLLTLAGISKKQDEVDAKAKAVALEQRRGKLANEYISKEAGTSKEQQLDDIDDTDEVCGLSSLTQKLDKFSPLALLNLHILRFIGRVSYSWYLWQVPLMHLEETFWVGQKAIGTTAIAFVAAMISTIYIEEPVRRAFTAWYKRERASTSTLPSSAPPVAARLD